LGEELSEPHATGLFAANSDRGSSMPATPARPTPSEINEKLGKRLQLARKALGLTQTQVGNALGISFQQIGKYESGTNTMSVPIFLAMCRAVNVKPSVLLDEYSRL